MSQDKQKIAKDIIIKGQEKGINTSIKTAQTANEWRKFYNSNNKEDKPVNKITMKTDNPDENAPSNNNPALWLIVLTFGIAYLLKMFEQAKKTTEKYNKERPKIKQKCEDRGYAFVDEEKTNIKDVVDGIKLYNEINNGNLKPEEKDKKQKELEKKCRNSDTLNNLLYSDKSVISTVRGFSHGATMIAKTDSKTGKREFALVDNGAKDKIPALCGFPNNEKISQAGIDCFKVDAGSRMCMSTVREIEKEIGEKGIDSFVQNFCISTQPQQMFKEKSSFYNLATEESEKITNIKINKNKLLNKKKQEKHNKLSIQTNMEKYHISNNIKKNNILNIKNVENNNNIVPHIIKNNVMNKNNIQR